METLVHISLFKPQDASGRHLGGVEEFAGYLNRKLGAQLISWSDFPMWKEYEDVADYEKASLLNRWLVQQGIVGDGTTVICDGYWGAYLPRRVKRLISVVHGTYWGRFLQARIYPWDEIVGVDEVNEQFELWSTPGVEIVACSFESQQELHNAPQRLNKASVIQHGVDLDIYKPEDEPGTLIMHGATGSMRKGWDVVQYMSCIDAGIDIVGMDEYSGDPVRKAGRLRQAGVLLAPTRHEGNSYLILQALACGVPIIGYKTGAVVDMDDRVGKITDDLSPQNFLRLLDGFEPSDYDPRGWAEENANLEVWAQEWAHYLDMEVVG